MESISVDVARRAFQICWSDYTGWTDSLTFTITIDVLWRKAQLHVFKIRVVSEKMKI
jgi:hypothetical protein